MVAAVIFKVKPAAQAKFPQVLSQHVKTSAPTIIAPLALAAKLNGHWKTAHVGAAVVVWVAGPKRYQRSAASNNKMMSETEQMQYVGRCGAIYSKSPQPFPTYAYSDL